MPELGGGVANLGNARKYATFLNGCLPLFSKFHRTIGFCNLEGEIEQIELSMWNVDRDDSDDGKYCMSTIL